MMKEFVAILGLSLPADKIDIARYSASSSAPVCNVSWFKSTSWANDGGARAFCNRSLAWLPPGEEGFVMRPAYLPVPSHQY